MARILGVMACICNLRNVRKAGRDESVQIFNEFSCPECDKARTDSRVTFRSQQEGGDCETMQPALLVLWQPLLSKLSLGEVSDRVQVCFLTCIHKKNSMEMNPLLRTNLRSGLYVELELLSNLIRRTVLLCFSVYLSKTSNNCFNISQVAFISSISRLLQHASAEELISSGTFWLTCLDILPLHEHRAVREAFCSQVHCFFSSHVLQGLLRSDDEAVSDSDRELEMLGKLRDALAVAKNSETTQSLLETVAEVAKVAHGRRHLLFFSLVLLLERLDHGEVALRAKSISLIHKIASNGFSTASGSIPQVT